MSFRASVGLVAVALCLAACKGNIGELPPDGGAGADGGGDAGAGGEADAGTDAGTALEPLTVVTGIEDGVALPRPGDYELRILSPTVLELVRIVSKPPDPAPVDAWDFVDEATGQLRASAPGASAFLVESDGAAIAVGRVGFRRRVRYAPLAERDLRVGSYLVLELASPVAVGKAVEVKNPGNALWPASMVFRRVAEPSRLSQVIHVNQLGYGRGHAKHAQVGYYLGSLGELQLAAGLAFTVVDARSGRQALSGVLTPRLDQGFTYSATPYQKVLQANFTALDEPGEYRLEVPGVGASYPFSIDDGVPAALARTYALGMLHQRCGQAKGLPFTRFDDRIDHAEPAVVPAASSSTWPVIASESSDFASHQAAGTPQLKDLASLRYPFVRTGKLDVSFGHHDAGDYSKYTTNSAALVHALTFAADAFPGAGALDNLGLPESGDGKSDLLQLARWEAEFLGKMQDDDGGFYFLVYPRDRRYEGNVTPGNGDGQLVWPKTTAVTAAASAALAELASSPTFKAQFPAEAAAYLAKAKKGWAFLLAAIAAHGKDGAYQKITHYGNEFRHDDELAWAAAALFLATGEASYRDKLTEWMPDPGASSIKRWGWWRLFDGYGNAMRGYAFAARTGRLAEAQLDATYLSRCKAEVVALGADQLARASASAYGTSFPLETKAYRAAGWYFSSEQAFDLVVAYQLDPRPELLGAAVSNFDYEAGSNPVNVSYLTGLGWKRPREVVHQWAQNDLRVLSPSGIPQGNIQSGFMVLGLYGTEPGRMSFPTDGATTDPYPFYDRWGDAFNVTAEFVVPQLGRALGAAAALMARTPLATQPWTSSTAQVTGVPAEVLVGGQAVARLSSPGLDLGRAVIVWDGQGIEPAYGASFALRPSVYGPQTLEAEAYLPDGRRVFAVAAFNASAPSRAGLPAVTMAATTPVALEAGLVQGKVTFSRSGDTAAPLRVRYSLGGGAAYDWDYNAVNGNYTNPKVNVLDFPAGAAAVDVAVQPKDDSYTEPIETVVFTLLVDGAYDIGAAGRAVVTLQDND